MSAAPEIRSPEDIIASRLAPEENAGDSTPWEISDERGAEWALARIRLEHRRCDEDTFAARDAIDALQEEIDRLRGFVADREAQRDGTVLFFQGKLVAYLRMLRIDDPKKASIKLSNGWVKSRAGRDTVEVEAPLLVAQQAAEQGFDFATWEPKVNKPKLLAHIKATGEIPDGARLITADPDDRTYSVEVEGVTA